MADDTLSDDDKALFRDSMRTVTPLKKNNKLITPPVVLSVTKPRHLGKPLSPKKAITYHLSDHTQETISSESIMSYCKQQIPHRRLKQLKQGEIPWEARLDLHGLTSDTAREALCRFIEKESLTNHRCLLIIHGKGSLRGEAPVLKNLVNTWLRQFPQVFAFHSAHARHGGSGALYVLLQKT